MVPPNKQQDVGTPVCVSMERPPKRWLSTGLGLVSGIDLTRAVFWTSASRRFVATRKFNPPLSGWKATESSLIV